jgi:6-pyruvoyltetrahydropterin/6-carboxytetrahydropterin synthase
MLVEEEDPYKAGTQNRVPSIEYRDMFTVSVETHFRASHQLDLPPDEGSLSRRRRPASKDSGSTGTEPEHYHNWLVTANVSSNKLDSRGVVMDFHKLRAVVDNIVAQFDNTALNKTDYFRQNIPSAENVAKYIYEKLEPKLPKGVKLRNITVIEEPGCSAKFAPAEGR